MPETSVQRKIFISYSHKDNDFVQKLRQDLAKGGAHIWIDHEELVPGTPNWERAIRRGILDSDAVIYIASENAYQSDFCQGELAVARSVPCPVYPVFIGSDFVQCIPIELTHAQYIDAHESAYESAVPRILKTLGILDAPNTIGDGILPASPPMQAPVPEGFVPKNPYKGLRAFTSEDAGCFFGRDTFIADLIKVMRMHGSTDTDRLLPIIGASGSGKSSVVMAGLLPRLCRGAVPGSDHWLYIPQLLPGSQPMENLAMALFQEFGSRLGIGPTAIENELRVPSGKGLSKLVRAFVPPGGLFVVYIDQFEEIFAQTVSEDERAQYITLLTAAATESQGIVSIVLTLRADFNDRPQSYPLLGKLIEAHHRDVLPLSLTDLYDVIQKPAQLPTAQLVFDEGLIGDLIGEVHERGDAMAGALPLLQFTLERLFEEREGLRLTRAAYNSFGGLGGALSQRAENTYNGLPEDYRPLARTLFFKLIEPGGTEQEIARRRASAADLTLTNPARTRILRDVADRFIQARLLTTSTVYKQTRLEVIHEALIREWPRLRDWLKEARGDLLFHQTLLRASIDWKARGCLPDDDAYLFRGSRLIDALNWATRNEITTDEADFVEASKRKQKALEVQEERQKLDLALAAERAEKAQAEWVATAEQAALSERSARDARRGLVIIGLVAAGFILLAIILMVDAQQSLSSAAETLTPLQNAANGIATQINAWRVLERTETAIVARSFLIQTAIDEAATLEWPTKLTLATQIRENATADRATQFALATQILAAASQTAEIEQTSTAVAMGTPLVTRSLPSPTLTPLRFTASATPTMIPTIR